MMPRSIPGEITRYGIADCCRLERLELYKSSHIERFKTGVWRTPELLFFGSRCFELIVSFPIHAEIVSSKTP